MKITKVLASLALAISTVGVVATASPASAVGCSGVGCDNKGPQGNGCFADDKVLGNGGGGSVQIRYSDACHAMWAYGPYAPQMWDVELQIEMQHYISTKDQWITERRITTPFEALGGADWTNALGARNANYRFRAIYIDAPGGYNHYTPWAVGGNR